MLNYPNAGESAYYVYKVNVPVVNPTTLAVSDTIVK